MPQNEAAWVQGCDVTVGVGGGTQMKEENDI